MLRTALGLVPIRKSSNINGVAIAAKAQGKSIADTGTIHVPSELSPVPFGTVVGRDCGTCSILSGTQPCSLAQANGAEFEDAGQWKRPWYFPQAATCMTRSIVKSKRSDSVGILGRQYPARSTPGPTHVNS